MGPVDLSTKLFENKRMFIFTCICLYWFFGELAEIYKD